MANKIVVFDQVWKKFERGERHSSLRDLLPAMARRVFSPRPPQDQLQGQQFWAVRDVSFAVEPGQALGIIGPNGAGKSTTLKLLTKILRPTRGQCSIKGRVGALIEVAAGFHPDLTGRENVYLQGAIMGMRRADITRKLDDIIEFSGLKDFIETPVKRYSSGMNARLGFSIAANLDPDALIIDEVLAVGDMAFQQRCIERMEEFKHSGVAIVFVSHNLQAVAGLCDRAIFLAGSVKAEGKPDEVIQTYVQSSADDTVVSLKDRVRITSARLVDRRSNETATMVPPGSPLSLNVSFQSTFESSDFTFMFLMYRSTDNLLLCDTHFNNADVGIPRIKAGDTFEVDFAFQANVARGHYRVAVKVYDNVIQKFLAEACPPVGFGVDELQTWAGVVHLDIRPSVRAVSPR